MHLLWLKALVVIAPLFAVACQTSDGKKAANPETQRNTSSTAKVSYDGFVKGWLSRECTSCHSAEGESPDLSTYALAKEHASKILASIQDKDNPMPKGGPLPSKNIVDKIKAWIKAGKPKSASDDSEERENEPQVSMPETVTYAGWMQAWLDDQCTSCHRPSGSASPDLSTYDQARRNIDAIIASIQNEQNPMPKGGPLPPDSTVAKVKAWRQAGTPRD